MNLNKTKLQKLIDNDVVKSIYERQNEPDDEELKINKIEPTPIFDAKAIFVDVYHTISVQTGYNYTRLQPTDIVCVISNKDNHYSMVVPYQNLKDLLDALDWDWTFSNQNTAELFNMLMLSSNMINRHGVYNKDLKSMPCGLTYHTGPIKAKPAVYYTVFGTDINYKKKFETIEDAYQAVKENFAENVLGVNKATVHNA